MMRIFLISPVRHLFSGELAKIDAYVGMFESAGHTVYWPYRDTYQDDDQDGGGVAICKANEHALVLADEVHIWWNPDSAGSLFDLGMAFALHKPLVAANRVLPTSTKSFENVVNAWPWKGAE